MKKKTSLADIAKALGVSKTLVSMVLNGKGNENGINEETQKRVWAKAKELNYKPNMMARGLRMGRSNTIGLIVADISNTFYAKLCRAVEDAASQKGFQVLFGSSDEKAEKERNLIQMLRDRQVDGLIISTTLENNRDIQDLLDDHFPLVLVDRFIPGLETPFVTADNFQGAVDATGHLISKGARRIGLLSISPSHLSSMTERVRGYRAALENHHLPYDASIVKEVPYDDIHGGISKVLPELLGGKQPVDALFVLNNNLTMAALDILGKLKKSIPKEVAVVSFDDVETFRFIQPSITAVAQPIEEMGVSAVDVLLDIILKNNEAQTQQVFLQTHLIARTSTERK